MRGPIAIDFASVLFIKETIMKTLFSILSLVLICQSAQAGMSQVNRLFKDQKLPTQQMIERQVITNPVVATTNYVLTTNAGPTSTVATTITSFTAQPDVPRNLTITPTGTTGDVESCA